MPIGPTGLTPSPDAKQPKKTTQPSPTASGPTPDIAGVTDPQKVDQLMGPLPPESPEALNPDAGTATLGEKLLMMGSVIAYSLGGNPEAAQNTVLMFQKRLAAEKQANEAQWDRLMQLASERRLRVARMQAGVTEARQLEEASPSGDITKPSNFNEWLALERENRLRGKEVKDEMRQQQQDILARQDKAEAAYSTAIHQTRMEAEAAISRHKGIDISGLGQSLARAGILDNLRMSVLGIEGLSQDPQALKQSLTDAIAAAIQLNNEAFTTEATDPETGQTVQVNIPAQNLARDFAGIMLRQASTLATHPDQLQRYINLMSDDMAWPSSSDITMMQAKQIVQNSSLAGTEPLTPEQIAPIVNQAGQAMRNALKGDMAVDYEEWRNVATILQAVVIQDSGTVDKDGNPVMVMAGAAQLNDVILQFEQQITQSLVELEAEGLISSEEDRDYYGNRLSELVQEFITDGKIPNKPLFYGQLGAYERAKVPSPAMIVERKKELARRKEIIRNMPERPNISVLGKE